MWTDSATFWDSSQKDPKAHSVNTINQSNKFIWQDISYDILREIYSWTMPYEMTSGLLSSSSGSLSALRYGTHVCQHWRNILLDSPLLWGQCVNFNAFQEETIEWLDTVLQRSRKSPLTVTGDLRSVRPSDLAWYFLDILNDNWQRVQNVSVSVQIAGYAEIAQWMNKMVQLLSRPTDLMQRFSVVIRLPDPEEPGPDILLFSQHTPALRTLSLSMVHSHFPITINAPLYNLRNLHLSKGEHETTDVELLTMCMQLPVLERLTLALSTVIISGTDLRPNLPRLSFIDIKSRDIMVYQAFLGRINPNNACAIHLTYHAHHLTWRPHQEDSIIQTIDGAFRVLRRHLDLLFSSKDNVLPDLRIRMTPRRILVTSSDPYPFELFWDIPEASLQFYSRIFECILTHLSVFTYPRQISQLDIFHDCPLLPHSSCLLGLLNSMSSVTSLIINVVCLLYIEDIVTNQELLPCLEMLIIYDVGEIQDVIPFLLRRQQSIPIRRLDLTGFPQCPIEYACGMLDVVRGLELVWFTDMPGRKETYICGSGGLQYAKRAPYYVTHKE